MFGHLCGISEWATQGICQEEGGRAIGSGKWAGVPGVASTAYRGLQSRVWPSVECLDDYVNFLQRFSVGNMESAGSGARDGDCQDPVRHRGVVPEVRTEAKGRGEGSFFSYTVLEPKFCWDCKLHTRALFSLVLVILFMIFLLISGLILDLDC